MRNDPWILGISASHNGAACLLRGNRVIVAIQEERLTRHKRQRLYGSKPSLAVEYCLQHAGLKIENLDLVSLSCQTSRNSPENDIASNPQFRLATRSIPVVSVPHHLAHAISAYATSGFSHSVVLVADGMGSPWEDLLPDEQAVFTEQGFGSWETISLYSAAGQSLTPLFKDTVKGGAWLTFCGSGMPRFGSLGGMFSAVAYQIFGNHMDAGKVMGLAPYGDASIPITDFYSINRHRFIFSAAVSERFPGSQRWPNNATEYQNLAASVQSALENALLSIVRYSYSLDPCSCICLSGGVALNSVAVECLCRSGPYGSVYVFPAAEDSGIALGAAYYGLWQMGTTTHACASRLRQDSYGHSYSKSEILAAVNKTPGMHLAATTDPIGYVADTLSDGKVVGWFQGGAELGPRALGQRSILFDPRRPDGQQFLNERVKHREPFRPFAPTCLAEEADRWFELPSEGVLAESPFMTRTVPANAQSGKRIPGVIHIDGSARVQTVTPDANGDFYELLQRFFKKTGVPVLLNTSFNISGQPLVESPSDALWSMLALSMDVLFLDRVIVVKKPSLTSILDLYPLTTAPAAEILSKMKRVTDATSASYYFSAPCESIWGSFDRLFPAIVADLIPKMVGHATVRQILAETDAFRSGTVREIDCIQIILELVNAKFIDLFEFPNNC